MAKEYVWYNFEADFIFTNYINGKWKVAQAFIAEWMSDCICLGEL